MNVANLPTLENVVNAIHSAQIR